ncbi:MAG: diiron oxygenase [Actinomycetota bacterium]|nr:diiron oxygenase [Actinomycetota bacterium]
MTITAPTSPTGERAARGDGHSTQNTARIAKLNAASLRRVVEPDIDVPGEVGSGPVIPRELMSVVDLGLDLSDDQWSTLGREELAAVVDAGIRFETLLMSGFSEMIAYAARMDDERIVYMLHEIGEETRHSRLFVRLLGQLQPTAVNPFARPMANLVFRTVSRTLIHRPTPLCILVLAGEEIPDLLQKKMAEHPETDGFIRDVSRYHRMEEARHLAFARTVLPELWERAPAVDRVLVSRVLPLVIRTMFDGLIHPGVYRTVGLPGWQTWRAVAASPSRVALRHEATRPVLAAMLAAGVVAPGRVPPGWRRLCGVDGDGVPITG